MAIDDLAFMRRWRCEQGAVVVDQKNVDGVADADRVIDGVFIFGDVADQHDIEVALAVGGAPGRRLAGDELDNLRDVDIVVRYPLRGDAVARLPPPPFAQRHKP